MGRLTSISLVSRRLCLIGEQPERCEYLSFLGSLIFLMIVAGWARAQTVKTFSYTVSLNPNQVTESWGHDTWLTPWQSVNYTLPQGGKVKFDIIFPQGHRIDTTDGWSDGNESIHLNVKGHYPAGTTPPSFPDNVLQVDYWLTGVNPADPGEKVPTPSHPWTSWNTPYPACVNPGGTAGTYNISYAHEYNMTSVDFSFTDVHAELTGGSLLPEYIIDEVQIGFDRDNIYVVPEPSSIIVLGGLGGLVFQRLRRWSL